MPQIVHIAINDIVKRVVNIIGNYSLVQLNAGLLGLLYRLDLGQILVIHVQFLVIVLLCGGRGHEQEAIVLGRVGGVFTCGGALLKLKR